MNELFRVQELTKLAVHFNLTFILGYNQLARLKLRLATYCRLVAGSPGATCFMPQYRKGNNCRYML